MIAEVIVHSGADCRTAHGDLVDDSNNNNSFQPLPLADKCLAGLCRLVGHLLRELDHRTMDQTPSCESTDDSLLASSPHVVCYSYDCMQYPGDGGAAKTIKTAKTVNQGPLWACLAFCWALHVMGLQATMWVRFWWLCTLARCLSPSLVNLIECTRCIYAHRKC